MRKKIVAGNWKMNTLPAEGVELAKQVAAGKHTVCDCVSFIVCPPFTHLSEVSKTLEGTGIAVGAQNCAAEAKGAYTGEVAASMIAALVCKYVATRSAASTTARPPRRSTARWSRPMPTTSFRSTA